MCFFKPPEDKECKCEIVKFVDRIWLKKEGNAFCLRDFIVHVQEESIPLSGIRLFMPYKNVIGIEDHTESCYDKDYIFNSFHAGGFEVKNIDLSRKRGTVDIDGISGVEICGGIGKNLEIGIDPVPPQKQASILSIDCSSHPIDSGKYRSFRISFEVTSLLDALFEGNVYRITLNYFDGSDYRDETQTLDIPRLEIPVLKFYREVLEGTRKIYHGGFDIFLYLDPDVSGTHFNSNKELVSKHQPDATEGGRNRQKFIWRARLAFPELQQLTMDNPTWELQGYVADPYQFKNIGKRLDKLETIIGKLWKDRKWVIISVGLGAVALGFVLYSLFF